MVFRQMASEIPQPFAHSVGRDGVRVLLNLVDTGFVLTGSFTEPAEEAGAEGGHRAGHGDLPLQATGHERHVFRLVGFGASSAPLGLHRFEPDMKSAQDGAAVESPLGQHVFLGLG